MCAARTTQAFSGFPKPGLVFLQQLKRNNNREWFQANRDAFERFVKTPMEELVLAIGGALRRTASEIVADPKVSIYRIYRDTRFSKDKSPYKTQVAAVFPTRGLSKHSGPGFYFHISPDEILVGGGIYMPEPEVLRSVREHIAAHPRKFLALVEGRSFRKAFGELEGERLKSVPKGFSADHAAAQYLRHKQFLFGEVHAPGLALTPRLLPTLLKCFANGLPLLRFLKEPAARASAKAGPALR